MTFSIIVVCLNGGEKLHKTIQSILDQTEEDYEIIVKDGGSADGSVEKLIADMGLADEDAVHWSKDGFVDEAGRESAAGKHLKIYKEKDSGIYDAMNQAVAHASGKYIFS